MYKILNPYDLIPENSELLIHGEWVNAKQYIGGLYVGRPVAEAGLECRIKQKLPRSRSSRANQIRFRKPPAYR